MKKLIAHPEKPPPSAGHRPQSSPSPYPWRNTWGYRVISQGSKVLRWGKSVGGMIPPPKEKLFSQIQKNIIWLINKNPSKSIKTSLMLKISYELPTLVKASQTAWPNVFPSTPVMTESKSTAPMASWRCWQNAPREVVESQTPSTCCIVSNGSNLIVTKIHISWDLEA